MELWVIFEKKVFQLFWMKIIVKTSHKTLISGSPISYICGSALKTWTLPGKLQNLPLPLWCPWAKCFGCIWKHMIQIIRARQIKQVLLPLSGNMLFLVSLTLLGLGLLSSIPMIRFRKNRSNFFLLSALMVPATVHTKAKRKRPCSQRKICWLVRPSCNSLSSSSIFLISSKSKKKEPQEKLHIPAYIQISMLYTGWSFLWGLWGGDWEWLSGHHLPDRLSTYIFS